MFCKEVRRDDRRHTYIDVTPPSFHGRCYYKEFRKWADTLDWMLEGDFYSERDKVQIATRTFDDEAFEWWDELKVQRRFYGERPINTWFDLKAAMRKQFRQNNYDEFLPQDRYQSDRELEEGHLDKEFDKLREGLEKIESLFSQWKESNPTLDKANEKIMETEHVDVHKVEDSLVENLESHEDEGAKSKKLDHDSLVDDDEGRHQNEVVFPFLCKDVIPNVHTSPTLVLVPLKFTKLSPEKMREEKEKVRVKNKSARGSMVRESKQKGRKRVIELLKEKKRKKVRNGKRVREKWFVLDVLQVTMARI